MDKQRKILADCYQLFHKEKRCSDIEGFVSDSIESISQEKNAEFVEKLRMVKANIRGMQSQEETGVPYLTRIEIRIDNLISHYSKEVQ
jgi:hypothetical protein